MDDNIEAWNPGSSPLERLARVEAHLEDIAPRVRNIEVLIEHHNEKCPAKTHTAYFRIMGSVLLLVLGGVVAALLKAFAK